MTNKAQRFEAIKVIQYKWIENEDPQAMGQLIHEGSFSDLRNDVYALDKLSTSRVWKSGVAEWLDTIHQMFEIFMEQSQFINRDIHWKNTDNAYGGETRKEFIRLLKHAIMQGSTYAYIKSGN